MISQVTRHRSRGIIVDVTALDVMDSFVSRSLRGIAHMTRLRGAETVIVGIQPEVAFAMVQLGHEFEDVQTALDLEEGLALLQAQSRSRSTVEADEPDRDRVRRRRRDRAPARARARRRARAPSHGPDPARDRDLRGRAQHHPLRDARRGRCCAIVRTTAGARASEVVARDEGPGIADIELALQDGYTTGGGLGLGLPGARRLVDEFDIQSAPERGHHRHAGQVGATRPGVRA